MQEKHKVVGQYMLGKTIGEGTFGKVKLAVHIPTGEKVSSSSTISSSLLLTPSLYIIGCRQDFGEKQDQRPG
jgi:serine/threonine protein kinase